MHHKECLRSLSLAVRNVDCSYLLPVSVTSYTQDKATHSVAFFNVCDIGTDGRDDSRACNTKNKWVVTRLQRVTGVELVAVERVERRIAGVDKNLIWSRCRGRESDALEDADGSGRNSSVSRHGVERI